MGYFHLCGFAIEESVEEDNMISNDEKRLKMKKTIPTSEKELNIENSLEKGNESLCLDEKEEEVEPSSLKGSEFEDAELANAKKDTNSKVDGPSFLAKARSIGLCGQGTSSSPPEMSEDGKIAMLCFEVANTVYKGAKLMESLSDENVKHCKEVVLQSEGIQRLVSGNVQELLKLVAADKRKELEVVSREVIRFGNRCKDSTFHNLGERFARFESEKLPDRLKEVARGAMKHLMGLARHASNLYAAMIQLKNFEKEYEKKCSEEPESIVVITANYRNNFSQKGRRAKDVKKQIRKQKRCVKKLWQKTLWSRKLEEVIVKLVDIVQFIHFEIDRAFDIEVTGLEDCMEKPMNISKTLSSAGLALHYAHIIAQIDNLVITHNSVPPALRKALYMSLPDNIKASLRPLLLSVQPSEFTIEQRRTELDKILKWLLPMANNTIKATEKFGSVESGMACIQIDQDHAKNKVVAEPNLIRMQTLDHAKKDQADEIILVLLVWLHRLVVKNINGSRAIQTQSLVDPQRKGRYASPTTMNTSHNCTFQGFLCKIC